MPVVDPANPENSFYIEFHANLDVLFVQIDA
jgi:hypothetical protein